MLGLDCTHPDIYEFLEAKANNESIQSANLSILFTDEFMNAVTLNSPYMLSFKVGSTGEVISKEINARDFFQKFCEYQFNYAEPGALYIDTIRNLNLLSRYPDDIHKIEICNPCAEFTGSEYSSCNLGSINLYNMVNNPFTNKAEFNWAKFSRTVDLGVKALDEILDYGRDTQPLEVNKKCIDDWRQIGLGFFGLADALIAMGIRYGSKGARTFSRELTKKMFESALLTSAYLAKSKGAFGKYNWNYIKTAPILSGVHPSVIRVVEEHGLRNSSLLSIAPTGTIGTMCGLSGGAEPLYAISYERTTHALEKSKKTFKVFAKSVDHFIKVNMLEDVPEDKLIKGTPYIVSAHDIDPLDRVRMQAQMQQYVDNAISSTVNLDNSATVEDIFNTYLLAWKEGCKGITIFRDGCARSSILGKEEPKDEPTIAPNITYKLNNITPEKRRTGDVLPGTTALKSTACVPKMYVTVNKKDGDVFEIFTAASQGCSSNIGTITRLASLALRLGGKIEEVEKEMKANICSACTICRSRGEKVSTSCGAAIAEAMMEAYKTGETVEVKQVAPEPIKVEAPKGKMACPSCGENTIRPEAKCWSCTNCGESGCD